MRWCDAGLVSIPPLTCPGDSRTSEDLSLNTLPQHLFMNKREWDSGRQGYLVIHFLFSLPWCCPITADILAPYPEATKQCELASVFPSVMASSVAQQQADFTPPTWRRRDSLLSESVSRVEQGTNLSPQPSAMRHCESVIHFFQVVSMGPNGKLNLHPTHNSHATLQ